MKAIQSFAPHLVPRPVAKGSWRDSPTEHFLLLEYHDLDLGPTDFSALPLEIAKLHLSSQGSRTTFGFPHPTYHGWLEQYNREADSWETFFSGALSRSFSLYKDVVNKINPLEWEAELEIQMQVLLNIVIPRLLRPLESGPHPIKPTLLHGDLWQGNFGIDKKTLRPMVFDPCCFWGHNECKSFFRMASLPTGPTLISA